MENTWIGVCEQRKYKKTKILLLDNISVNKLSKYRLTFAPSSYNFKMVLLKIAVLAIAITYVMAYPAQQYGAPVRGPQYAIQEEPYEERNYKVYYSVKDDPSYNYQSRNEEKNGNTVTGQYTVLEPTGELRVVNYIADDYGFRADVQNQANYGPAYVPKPAAHGRGY